MSEPNTTPLADAAPPPVNAALPNVDGLFPAKDDLPDVEKLFPPEIERSRKRRDLGASPVADMIFGNAEVSPLARVLDAFGQGTKDNWGAPEIPEHITDFMRKSGIYNDYDKGQKSLAKTASEVLLWPYVHLFAIPETGVRGLAAVTAGAQAAVTQIGEETGQRSLARDIAAMPESLIPEVPHFAHDLTAARDLKVIGPDGEAAWAGTKQAAALPEVDRALAAIKQLQDEQKAAEVVAPAVPQPKPADIHSVARQLDLNLFGEYDALKERQDTFRGWLNEMEAQPAQAEHAATKQDLEKNLAEIDHRLEALAPDVAKTYKEAEHTVAANLFLHEPKAVTQPGVIDQTHDVKSGAVSSKDKPGVTYIDPHIPEFSPILKDREGNPANLHKYLAIHEQTERTAMANGMSYDAAHTNKATPAERAAVEADGVDWKKYTEEMDGYLDKIEHEKVENPPPDPHVDPNAAVGHHKGDNKAAPAPVAPALPSAVATPEPKPISSPEMVKGIADTEARKIAAAGRPQEEAQAAAAVIATHYEARAQRFNGAKGTAADLYAAEAPAVRGEGTKYRDAAANKGKGSLAPGAQPRKGSGGPASKPEADRSLLEQLAAKGGLKPTPDLIAIVGKNKFIPGFGPLLREKGMAIDDAIQTAKESGHLFDKADIEGSEARVGHVELLDLIDKEARGEKQFAHGFELAHAIDPNEQLHRIGQKLDQHLSAQGIDPASVPERTRDRAIEIMDRESVSDPDVAYERAVMEDDQGEQKKTPEQAWNRYLAARQERNERMRIATGFNDYRTKSGSAPIRAKSSQVWEPGNVVDVGFVKDLLISAKNPDGSFTLLSKPDASGLSQSYNSRAQEGLVKYDRVDFASATEALEREYAQGKAPDLFAQREAEGQTNLPGTERIGQGELAQRKADQRLKPTVAQKPADEGLFGDGAAQKSLFQTKRGKIRLRNDGSSTITLFKEADASTFIHETGHQWLEELMRDAQDAKAPDDLKADARTVLDWLGVPSATDIRTAHHEKFARGFETYMMEGRAPTQALALVFAKFRDWLIRIYQTVDRLHAPINDQIRGVFDRLVAHKPEENVIAPERATAHGFADIHEADAERLGPHEVYPAMVTAQSERDRIAAAHLPEEEENRLADTGREAAGEGAAIDTPGGAQPHGDGAAAEPLPGEAGVAAQPGAVGAGGSAGPGQGARPSAGPRTEVPADANVKFAPSESGFIDKAGNIRLDKLDGPEGFDEAIREAATRNHDFIDQRRGVISDGMALDLADAMGMDPAFLDLKKIGDAFNQQEIIVAKKLLIQSATDVRDLMKQAASTGADEDAMALAAAIARHEMIQGKVAQATAEWGRAGRALRMIIGGQQEAADLSRFLQENTGRTLFQLKEMAQYGSRLTTPSQISKFVADTAGGKIKRAVIFYYVNALISGPITHMRYAAGNALNALYTPLVEIPFSAASGAVREALGRETGDSRVFLGEAGAQLYGLLKGSRDGLSAAIDAWQSGQSAPLPSERVSAQFADHGVNPIPGPVGSAIAVPGKAVAAIHSFFKSLRYEQNIQGLAYRQVMQETLTGDKAAERIAKLTSSPTAAMMESATKDALKELFMAPTDYHSFMGLLTRATNTSLLAKIVVPFMKIGTQITRNALIERTPLGFVDKDVRGNLMMRNSGADFDMQAGKQAAGLALIGTSVMAAAEGLMTGDGPEDPAKRAIWLLNHRPNSVQIGGITLPYQGLGHLGMLMRFSANMYETAHGWDGEDGAKLAVSFFQGITKSILDENFMRGLKDMLDAMYHPQEYGASYIKGFLTNWIPFSVGLSQVAREIDPYQREAHSIFHAAQAKIPWLSEQLMPRRDRFGEPIPNGAPLPNYADDPVVKTMEALHIGVGKLERKIRGVELTDQQYDDFTRVAGRMAKMRLDALVKTPGFARMPDAMKVETIHSLITSSHESARNMVMMQAAGGPNDILRKATEAKRPKTQETVH